MRDITPEEINRVREDMGFALFISGQDETAKEVYETIKVKYPMALASFAGNFCGMNDNFPSTLSQEDKDFMLNVAFYNFAFTLKVLDFANNGEEPIEEEQMQDGFREAETIPGFVAIKAESGMIREVDVYLEEDAARKKAAEHVMAYVGESTLVYSDDIRKAIEQLDYDRILELWNAEGNPSTEFEIHNCMIRQE